MNRHWSLTTRQLDAKRLTLLARELGITPTQLRSLRLTDGSNWVRIRTVAARLRRQ
jgi:hypothetical protein